MSCTTVFFPNLSTGYALLDKPEYRFLQTEGNYNHISKFYARGNLKKIPVTFSKDSLFIR